MDVKTLLRAVSSSDTMIYERLSVEKSFHELTQEFDKKLSLCLDKIRENGIGTQIECVRFYEEKAKQLLDAVIDVSTERNTQILMRAIQSFDALLEERADEKNNEQMLILIRDLGQGAKEIKVISALFGFLAATSLVLACVFAIPTMGISLLGLICVLECGIGSYVLAKVGLSRSLEQDKLTSFVEAGQGFFSEEGESSEEIPTKEKKDSLDSL